MKTDKTSINPLNRPLSPHLQVWKWTLTMALSIFHRASGVALALGTVVLVWMLASVAGGMNAYECFYKFITSIFGQILLFGWTGAIFYHLFSGIRHLIMDMGYLINIPAANKAGYIIIVTSVALTLAIWGCAKFLVIGV